MMVALTFAHPLSSRRANRSHESAHPHFCKHFEEKRRPRDGMHRKDASSQRAIAQRTLSWGLGRAR
jgi:hypothetical protein